MDNTINVKLVVLGEGGVGKTSLINTFMGRPFPEQYLPTIGGGTTKKEYVMEDNGNIIRVLVSIWDTGGQRSFNPFNPALYRNIDICLLVFDLTRPKETLKLLKEEFLEHVNDLSDDVLKLYVGNKLDILTNDIQVKSNLSDFLSKNDNVVFVSAKTGQNVSECLELLIYTFLKKAEILFPDIIKENTSTAFLNLINKKESQLKTGLINLNNLESVLKKQKITLKTKDKKVDDKEIKELKYYDFLKQELEKNSIQKTNVMDQFLINLSELEKTINHLKKIHSKSPETLISNVKKLLITAKKDFEQNIELIEKLNREEFELVKIISKTKEEQVQFN
ncbi:MAG: Rab family GTPase [Candidatus Hermodarchaeota archaeon]